MYMSMRDSHGHVPWSFLQSSYKVSVTNANWIVRLIAEMDALGLYPREPYMGYLVAIAATVHLDRSAHNDKELAVSAQHRFRKCYEFVSREAIRWPNVANAVRTCPKILHTLTPSS